MTDGDLPENPGMAHELGNADWMDPESAKDLARQERAEMRHRALDDRMLAACLDAFGGDERTARIYWEAGRIVAALGRGAAKITDPGEMVDYLREAHPEWIGEVDA